jgi:hypothetical protein
MNARARYTATHWGDDARRVDEVFVPSRQRFGVPVYELASIAYSTTKAGDHNRWNHDFECAPRLCRIEPQRIVSDDHLYMTPDEARAIAAQNGGKVARHFRDRGLGVLPIVDLSNLVQLGVLYELLDVNGRRIILPGVDVAFGYDEMHEIHALVLCGPPWLQYQIEIVYNNNGSAPYITDHGIEG